MNSNAKEAAFAQINQIQPGARATNSLAAKFANFATKLFLWDKFTSKHLMIGS